MKNVIYEVGTREPTKEAIKIRKCMFKIIKELNPTSVLEIGSGLGYLGDELAREHIDYTGIEPEKVQFDMSRQKFPSTNIIQASCYDNPVDLKLGQYDLVVSNDVIEHLYTPGSLVNFAKQCVKPGGKVITCTPQFGSYFKNIFYSLFNKWDLVHSPLWDGGHIKFFSDKTLKQLFEQHGFANFSFSYVRNINYPVFHMSVICICSIEKK